MTWARVNRLVGRRLIYRVPVTFTGSTDWIWRQRDGALNKCEPWVSHVVNCQQFETIKLANDPNVMLYVGDNDPNGEGAVLGRTRPINGVTPISLASETIRDEIAAGSSPKTSVDLTFIHEVGHYLRKVDQREMNGSLMEATVAKQGSDFSPEAVRLFRNFKARQ